MIEKIKDKLLIFKHIFVKKISLYDLSEDMIDKIIINKELEDNGFLKELNQKAYIIFKSNLFKNALKKILHKGRHTKKTASDLYIFPRHFFIRKAEDMIPKSLFHKITNDMNSYLLFNEKDQEIFLINLSVKYFLDAFRKPNSLMNVAKRIKGGTPHCNEEHDFIKKFFSHMIFRNVLVSTNNIEDGNNIFTKNVNFPNLDIIQILKKSKIAITAIAFDTKRKEQVMVKYLLNGMDKKAMQIFQHEFEIMNIIGLHPLIRSLISFDKENNIAILEYIKGRTLEELILIGKLKMKHKLFLAYQVIKSLSILHEKQVIHGDIHINQFLVEPNLNIKMIDFGNSIYYLEKNVMTMKGGVCNYLEPEIVLDNAFVNFKKYALDFHMDIYRLGVLIYFLMYEKYPFDSFSWKQLCKSICTEEPKLSAFVKDEAIPLFVIAILKKSLSKDFKIRFQSASEVLIFFNKEYEKYNKEAM